MKKLILTIAVMAVMLVSGCQKASELVSGPTPTPVADIPVTTFAPIQNYEPIEGRTQIEISQTLKMTNEWSIIGDYDVALTGRSAKDRVVLGTSAQEKNGEIMWDDSQYWTIAVLNEDGAYNLFSERMSGQVYMEINEAFVNGFATPVVTAYIFSGTDREIRNYAYIGNDCFEETILFNTKEFSTGGVNCLYSTVPESEIR